MSPRFRWPVLAVALVGIFMIARASAVPGDAEDKAATDSVTLLKRIAALEQRVASLEDRPQIVQAPATLPTTEVPKRWGNGSQINGQTFYFIPLSTSKNNNASEQRAPIRWQAE